jgi:dienelactone hydrolase
MALAFSVPRGTVTPLVREVLRHARNSFRAIVLLVKLPVLSRGLFALVIVAASLPSFAQTAIFNYDSRKPLDIRHTGAEMRDGITVEDISFANLAGGRTEAYLVIPPGMEKCAGALFIHWYDSESPLSNRKQFLNEAVELAHQGLLSLLVATPWSDPQWYEKRDVTKDFDNSVLEVQELRRATDVLLAQPRVDAKRLALVGHDFGAMYGVLAAAAAPKNRSFSAIALQAFTGSFSDWFLYNQKQLSPEARQRVIDRLAPLDPLRYLDQMGPGPVLLQFAEKDFYVPREKADAIYRAVRGPKQIRWYDSGHGLNDQASADREKWLREALKLK